MRFRARCGLALGLLAVAAPVAAQTDFRETVVVTAAATPITLASATRALTIITRDEIEALPVHTVADVLRLVASVDVRARGVRGMQTDLAIRGAHFGQTLVLVDGVRLNDAQSGHHNGDIPIPLDQIERIEVLHGPGSSLFGADAFGGTINVITRRDAAPAAAELEAGSFGLVAGRARAAFARGDLRQTLAASADRSDGFMVERGFRTANVSARTLFGDRGSLSAAYLWKDFGANGFYGPAPSHERTSQLLLSADRRFRPGGGWELGTQVSYRTHGDHFLYDVRTPGVAENRHRTHAAIATLKASRALGAGTSVTFGMEGGGDWIRSGNLGDHATARVSGFGEWRQALSESTQVEASLRVDRYDEFGTSWSPAAGIGWWPSAATRLRASVARAFRVPTFTERYYRDPANWARPDLAPETAWAGDAGADLFLARGVMLSATLFARAEDDVIDWLRPTPADVWRTYNIRDVDTVGIELSARTPLGRGAFVQAAYTATDLQAAPVDQLSKYVLDYAPHVVTAAAAIPLPAGLRFAPHVTFTHRRRAAGPSNDAIVDARLSRRVGAIELFVEGTNLTDAEYQEIAGVPMPGRALVVSAALRPQ